MSSDLRIDQVEAWACTLPLPQPIDFGAFQVHERHHVVIRVRTRGGLVADCVAQSRGSPIDVAVADLIAPRMVGREATQIAEIGADVGRALLALETDGVLGRAWSVAEICLQDLRAQAAGLPLWRMLGAHKERAPVQLVEGYALVGESDEAFAERLAARVAEGFEILKIEAAHYKSADEILARLRAFRRLAGEAAGLVLDFAWTWRDAHSHQDLLLGLADLGVLWIEDPFPRTRVGAYRDLRALSSVPVGCGDEATRAADLTALMRERAIDQLRADATTIGGIEALRLLTAEAQSLDLGVSYHEHPETHEHCVFGFAGVGSVEVFPSDRPFDRVHDLVRESVFERIRDGWLSAPERPGTGVRLRDDVVRAHAHRHHVIGSGDHE
jgi:L-alanine-DL-glutamate epimerase-like enolase superfamily enzyme